MKSGAAHTALVILSATAVYLALALLSTYPLVTGLHDGVVTTTDSWLNIYTLSYLSERLTDPFSFGALRFLDGVHFFPDRYSLGLTETLVGLLPIYLLPYLLGESPVFAYNFLIILALTLNGAAAHFTAYRLTRSTAAAFCAGIIAAAAPAMINHLAHLQLLALWWTPLAYLAFCRLRSRPSLRSLQALLLCLVLQWASSIYLGLFLATALALLFMVRGGLLALFQLGRSRPAGVILTLAASAGALILIAAPQIIAASHYGIERTVADNIAYSATWRSFILPPEITRISRLLPQSYRISGEQAVSAGIAPLLLIFAAVLLPRSRRNLSPYFYDALLVAGAAAIFAFGPYYPPDGLTKEFRLPYYYLLEYLKPYRAMRVPARWGLMYSMFIALAASTALAALTHAYAGKQAALRRMLLAAFIAIIAAQIYRPHAISAATFNQEELAVVNALLRAPQHPAAVIFWPLPESRPENLEELNRRNAKRANLALRARRPMLNGYSGFFPESYHRRVAEINRARPGERRRILAQLGIGTAVELKRQINKKQLRLCPGAGPLILHDGPALRVCLIRPKPAGITPSSRRSRYKPKQAPHLR